jgi:hypothetical protein
MRKRNGRGNSGWVGVSKQEHCIISWVYALDKPPRNKGSPRKRLNEEKETFLEVTNVAGPDRWPAVGVFGDELSFLICFICFT